MKANNTTVIAYDVHAHNLSNIAPSSGPHSSGPLCRNMPRTSTNRQDSPPTSEDRYSEYNVMTVQPVGTLRVC